MQIIPDKPNNRSDSTVLMQFALAGFVSGAIAKIVELPWVSNELAVSYLGGVGSGLSIWLVIIVLIVAMVQSTLAKKMIATTLYFIGMCLGYYLVAELFLGLAEVGFVLFWLLASITAVPVVGLAIAWAIRQEDSKRRRNSLIAIVLLSGVVAVPIVQAVLIASIRPFGSAELLRIATEAVFVVVLLALVASDMKQRIKLLLAAILWLPVMWLAFEGLLRFLSLLY